LKVVTGVVVGGVAGQGAGQIAANAGAPYAAEAIGDYFTEPGHENQTAQVLSHAVLGAILASANGGSALGGAGEIAAQVISRELYPHAYDADGSFHPDRLDASQTNTVIALSTGVGALVAGATGKSLTDAAVGGNVAANAATNNWLKHEEKRDLAIYKQACANGKGDQDACGKAAGLEVLDKIRNQALLNACVNLTVDACKAQLALNPAARAYGVEHVETILGGKILSSLGVNSSKAIQPLAEKLEAMEIKPLVDAKGVITGWAVDIGSSKDPTGITNALGATVYVGAEIILPTNAIDLIPGVGKGLKIAVRGAERVMVDKAGTAVVELAAKTPVAPAVAQAPNLHLKTTSGDHATTANLPSSRQNENVSGLATEPSATGTVGENTTSGITAAERSASFQGVTPYDGVDTMRNIGLQEGVRVANVTFRTDGIPVSEYFTTESAIRRTILPDGNIDANRLNHGLQIYAGIDPITGLHRPDFKPMVQFFEVIDPIPSGQAAFGRTLANPQLNPARYPPLPQLFINKEFHLSLRPVELKKASNTGAPPYSF
jgi:Pre-toxin domain with VENN motif